MYISEAERKAILTVIRLGAEFGYGNLMQHMATAWARFLMEQHRMDEQTARKASFLDGYPFAMQDDLVKHGFWDETGERYKAGAKAKGNQQP